MVHIWGDMIFSRQVPDIARTFANPKEFLE